MARRRTGRARRRGCRSCRAGRWPAPGRPAAARAAAPARQPGTSGSAACRQGSRASAANFSVVDWNEIDPLSPPTPAPTLVPSSCRASASCSPLAGLGPFAQHRGGEGGDAAACPAFSNWFEPPTNVMRERHERQALALATRSAVRRSTACSSSSRARGARASCPGGGSLLAIELLAAPAALRLQCRRAVSGAAASVQSRDALLRPPRHFRRPSGWPRASPRDRACRPARR